LKMWKTTIIALVVTGCLLSCLISLALAADRTAVSSNGEVNAKDNKTGTVIAGTKADLALTVMADMSKAEPGEEIKSIQIMMPDGFKAGEGAVTAVTVGGEEIPNFESVVSAHQIIVTLPTLISLTTIIDVEFTVDTPASPGSPLFTVGLLNISQNIIIPAIEPGNADGRLNNDKLTIQVVAATKPQPPSGVSIQPDPGGENDLVISWTQSDDPAVNGYLIYRADKGDDPIADVAGREQTFYIDRGLEAGREYSYTIRSYKTKALKSDASSIVAATATPDTKDPESPAVSPEVKVTEKGIQIGWGPSSSRDVVRYIIYRGSSLDSLQQIGEVGAEVNSYTDENPPTVGSYLYVVGAMDDAGRETKSSPTQIRQATVGAKPQPNPFTPLSSPPYNQVTFPAVMLEGGEGTFAVEIYDLEGDLVFQKEAEEGSRELRWDGKDMNGEYVSSGVYVYQATMGDKYKIGTVIVAR
jgi:hypothetical protein